MKPIRLLLLLCLLPFVAEGAVTINEVAWMGTANSANHEWIELYNDGGAASLDGWMLTDGENLTIDLTGTIPGNSFAVLERTSDDSAPGSAFLIYTGAMKNTGATLQLVRTDGGLEDHVSGGEDWQNIGGDNVTKETAQYTSSGWVTAMPTPGATNKTVSTVTNEPSADEQEDSSVGRIKKSDGTTSEPLILPGNTLRLKVDASKQVFVNQSVDFTVTPSGVGNTIENSLVYRWNFGDINTSTEKDPTHVFTYPGTYMVSVRAEYGTQDAIATHEITVLPIAVSMTTNEQGDIQINNDSPYDIDISGYRLRAHEAVEVPEHTWLLSRQTITVPHEAIQASPNALIVLYDSQGEMVTSKVPHRLQRTIATTDPEDSPEPLVVSAPRRNQLTDNDNTFRFVSEAKAAEPLFSDNDTDIPTDEEAVVPLPGSSESQNWPIIALVVLLSLGCVVVLMQPSLKRDRVDIHESK